MSDLRLPTSVRLSTSGGPDFTQKIAFILINYFIQNKFNQVLRKKLNGFAAKLLPRIYAELVEAQQCQIAATIFYLPVPQLLCGIKMFLRTTYLKEQLYFAKQLYNYQNAAMKNSLPRSAGLSALSGLSAFYIYILLDNMSYLTYLYDHENKR
jgi:hypothetical protein